MPKRVTQTNPSVAHLAVRQGEQTDHPTVVSAATAVLAKCTQWSAQNVAIKPLYRSYPVATDPSTAAIASVVRVAAAVAADATRPTNGDVRCPRPTI
jgi:hypothetical protein